MKSSLTDRIMAALRTVKDPDLGSDLVSLDMIKDLETKPDGTVSLRVVLTTPACPMKAAIEADVRRAVGAVEGVSRVEVKMDAEVRRRAPAAGAQAGGSTHIEGVSHIIAVSSGKGGVGKSTVAANLATALALEGARVGLMDADMYGPNIPTMMGVTEQPKIEQDPVRGDLFVPPVAHGVKVMSMGFLVQGDQPMIWRGPMLHSVVNQFCHKVNWGQLDYLIVDMPPGTGDVQLSLAQLVPVTGAVVVTTPQEVSLQDVRKAIHMFEKVRIPIMGIVENMSWFECDSCSKKHAIFGSDGGERLAKKFATELLAQLPIQQQVREGGDEGRPVVIRHPGSSTAEAFRTFARKVAQQASILSRSGTTSEPIQIGRF
ncbi:MAG: Mrp/NBP35 family ATP-binding protein [Oligoflexia bacterium]|nr:Mrp/NBP35 family ATP-binding protein [Oligoflexia bacterium]